MFDIYVRKMGDGKLPQLLEQKMTVNDHELDETITEMLTYDMHGIVMRPFMNGVVKTF